MKKLPLGIQSFHKIVEACDKLDIAMAFTGLGLFHH